MRNKKILGLLLAGVMVTSIPFNVFADEPAEPTSTPVAEQQADDQGGAEKEVVDENGAPKTGDTVEGKVTVNFIAVLVEEGKDNSTETLGSEVTIDKGAQIAEEQLPSKEKTGYDFGGWYSDKELNTKFEITKKLEDTTTIYAKFTKKAEKFTVTFKFYDNRGDKVVTVNENETTAPPNLFNTRKGYRFDGWYDENGHQFNKNTKVTKNLTLNDRWTKLWSITFDLDGGTGSLKREVPDKDQLMRPHDPEKKGFKFVGWYTDAAKTTEYDFDKLVTKDMTLYAKWEKIEEEKPAVPTKEDLYISDIEYDGNFVTGKVTSKGKAVKDATVTLKIDGSKTGYKDETDEYGRFKVYLGKYYDDYRYYNNDYYYYRNGDRYYDGHRVYRDSDGDYYYKKGNDRVYIGYSNYYRRYRDYKADLVAEKSGYYSTEKNLWKDGYYNNGRYYGSDWYSNKYDHRVYPTDISRSNYSTSGYLKGYKNRTVYVYDDGTYLGSDTIDSDGYFKVSWNSPRVSTSRSLEYYVNGTYKSDSGYSMIPVVNNVSAGAKFVRGNAGAYADVTVYDSNGTRLGGASAGSTGIFNISLNRELRAGETIKVEAKESGKTSRSTEVKIAGQEAKVAAKVNSPSYIAGYPDGTFKPGKEVTRAEAVRMFVTLVNEGKELPKNPTTKFKDANNKWYSDEINFAVSKGFISGYSDGTFKPNQGITRAEFAQMIAVFVKDGYPGSSNFKDVKGHWASNAIDQLYGNKNIKGFPDGTFKPDQKLTRAEAVTVLNSVFGRNTKSTSFANVNTNSLKKFSDVPMSHWAYYEIIDASNGHNAVKGDKAEDVSVWQ